MQTSSFVIWYTVYLKTKNLISIVLFLEAKYPL